MKRTILFGFLIVSLFFSFFVSCSTNKTENTVVESLDPQPISQEPEQIPEPEKEIPVAVEPATEQDAEYLRSIAAVSDTETISMDMFTNDKKEVLELIDQIETTMKTGNYQRWLSYVEPASIRYWQTPSNLKEIENRLPVKGLKINSMQDYFKYIFIPARTDRTVDEIRYISGSLVKAVQVQGDTDIIYYTFEKINGKWMLKLDTLS